MDLSPLIFVALAVAWAGYLVPKALKHHDEVVRSRSVDKFSHTMRVLAHREPVSRRNARLVVSPVRPAGRPAVETKARTSAPAVATPVASSAAPVTDAAPAPAVPAPVVPAPVVPAPVVARTAARRAARRRRRVLGVVLLANAVVVGLAVASVLAWPWVAVPVAVLVAWLVACRLSVRAERRSRRGTAPVRVATDLAGAADPVDAELTGEVAVVPAPASEVPGTPAPMAASLPDLAADAPAVLTGEVPVVPSAGGWDMVPTTLPTYVTKPAAHRRTVSTIDLDSTGVWSSGRHDGDSALARSAEEAEQAARDDAEERRASGA